MAKKRVLSKIRKSYKKTKKMFETVDKIGNKIVDDIVLTTINTINDPYYLSKKLKKKEIDFIIEKLKFSKKNKNNLKMRLKKKLKESPIYHYFTLLFKGY